MLFWPDPRCASGHPNSPITSPCSPGQGLGVENQGRVDPIRAAEQIGFTGLGKTEQDKHMMTAATFKPRELASARQERETNDQKRAREEANVKKQQTHEQVADMLEKFFCDICNKVSCEAWFSPFCACS